jgi:DNA mismatch endonuclease (patch repair protein)
MQSNTSRDTGPEVAVRQLLFARGLRYRVDRRPLPSLRRRADIVFVGPKIAVFIDGCFWHGCPEHGTTRFGTNSEFWINKIETNVARDFDTTAKLEAAGWSVLRFWEHVPPADAANEIESAVRTVSGP